VGNLKNKTKAKTTAKAKASQVTSTRGKAGERAEDN
jgi:hypothetical protein